MSHHPLLVLLCAACLGVSAQPARQQDSVTAVAAERLAWTSLRGTAVDLTVGSDGTAFSLDPDGRVWMRRPGLTTSWLTLPGKFKRIDAADERDAWAIDADGSLFRYNGTYWRPVTGPKAIDVGVGPGGTAYFATTDGGLIRLDTKLGFVPVPGAPKSVTRIDVDDRELPWVVLGDASIRRFDGRNWVNLPGRALDISAGTRNSAFIVGTDHQPARWNNALGTWGPMLAFADLVATAPDNKPWIATPDGLIFANDPGGRRRGASLATQGSAFVQTLSWSRVQGKAKSLAISAKGQIMALGTEGEVWQWKGKGNWQRMPGNFDRIALEPSGIPMAVGADGRIFTLRGSQWVELPGRARDVSITPQGVAWILLPDGSPAFWNPQSGWISINEPGDAVRLAVGSSNTPWAVTREGKVRYHDGKTWIDVDGVTAAEIAVGPEGSVFVIGRDKKITRFDASQKRWEQVTQVAGDAIAVAVGPKDKPWVITSNADIYASSLFDEPVLLGGECSNAVGGKVPDLRPADFQQARNAAARDIAIGKDGNVMIADATSNLAQWRNLTLSFKAFPGQMSRIAVAPNGDPWGITVSGEVWRHDGSKWQVVRNTFTAREIAIGCNGTVIVAASDESLHRYIPRSTVFEKLVAARPDDPAPKGSKLAVDPQGKPWTISGEWVYRCDNLPCERQAIRAKDIAIGPEGTLMVADVEGNLQAFNSIDNRWERIGLSADAVAVGPGGKPWILRNGSEVWYSALFPRSEEKDDEKAAGTQVTAANTVAAPVFTFSVSMAFDKVTLPAGFSGTGPVMLAFSPQGKLVVIDTNRKFWNYNEATKSFYADNTVPDLAPYLIGDYIKSFVIAPDGTYWLTNDTSGESPQVWRRQGGVWINVPIPADCSGPCFPSPIGVAIAPDGSVYATSEGNNFYRYDASQQRFISYTGILRPAGGAAFIAIDSNGRYWAASPSPATLYELVGSSWQKRTDAVLGAPSSCFFGPAPCVSIGANGSAFGYGANNRIVRWNALAGVWENIGSAPMMGGTGPSYVTGPDGRPWVWTGAGPPATNPQTLYRAR